MALEKGRDYIDLRGRDYVLFPALLNLATERGMTGINSELIQSPSKENEMTAIVVAEITFQPDTGAPRIFRCLGDASPATTKLNAYVRMAETRAIGRALRMALNIGETMLEELGDNDEPVGHMPSGRAYPSERQSSAPANGGDAGVCSHEGCGAILTPNQIKLSMAKFNVLLCPLHQRDYAAVS